MRFGNPDVTTRIDQGEKQTGLGTSSLFASASPKIEGLALGLQLRFGIRENGNTLLHTGNLLKIYSGWSASVP